MSDMALFDGAPRPPPVLSLILRWQRHAAV